MTSEVEILRKLACMRMLFTPLKWFEEIPLHNKCLTLALLLLAYGTSDNAGIQELLQ